MDWDKDEQALVARELAYRVLHALLSQPPSRANVEVALSDVLAQAFELAGAPCDAAALAQLREAFARDPESLVRQAGDQYQRLFYAPGRLVAPPWESSYTSPERKVFQRSTLAVRDAYRQQGFRPVCVNRIPDDHVAIELCFLAHLAKRAADTLAETAQASNSDARVQALAASRSFLTDHLGRWVDEYAQALKQAAGGGLYAYVADCLRAFVHADLRNLAAISERNAAAVSGEAASALLAS